MQTSHTLAWGDDADCLRTSALGLPKAQGEVGLILNEEPLRRTKLALLTRRPQRLSTSQVTWETSMGEGGTGHADCPRHRPGAHAQATRMEGLDPDQAHGSCSPSITGCRSTGMETPSCEIPGMFLGQEETTK